MNEMITRANEAKKEVNFWTRFNSCNAYTSESINGIILIKSYNTIVGCVDVINEKVYEFGKYSRTTSKQFTQICNQRFYGYERIFINECNW